MNEINTEDYRDAPGGCGPQASQWRDKPHRLVYDLCSEIDRLRKEKDKFTRTQLETVVHIIIQAAVETFADIFPGRYTDGSQDDEWRHERATIETDKNDILNAVVHQLGNTLSNLFVTLSSDGFIGLNTVAEAGVERELTLWSYEWEAGNVGYAPTEGHKAYNAQKPDTRALARLWVEKMFTDYLSK